MHKSYMIKHRLLNSTGFCATGTKKTGIVPTSANSLLTSSLLSSWLSSSLLLFVGFKRRISFSRTTISTPLIEVGPSPMLTGVAMRTLRAKYERIDGSLSMARAILCHSKNGKEIYYIQGCTRHAQRSIYPFIFGPEGPH